MARKDCDTISTAVDEFCAAARRQVDDYVTAVTTLDKLKSSVEAKKQSLLVLKQLSWEGKDIQPHIETIDGAVRIENDRVTAEVDGVTARRRDIDELYEIVDDVATKFLDFQKELRLHKPAPVNPPCAHYSSVVDDTSKPLSEGLGIGENVFRAVLSALQNTKADVTQRAEDSLLSKNVTATPVIGSSNEDELKRMRKLYMV